MHSRVTTKGSGSLGIRVKRADGTVENYGIVSGGGIFGVFWRVRVRLIGPRKERHTSPKWTARLDALYRLLPVKPRSVVRTLTPTETDEVYFCTEKKE